ncbi:MAG: hypothetical protein AAFX46_16275 [Cyanobacteria bacterium J06636_27]
MVEEKSINGYNTRKFADRIGMGENSVSLYIKSAKVWSYLRGSDPGQNLVREVKKLVEISKTPQQDWLYLILQGFISFDFIL